MNGEYSRNPTGLHGSVNIGSRLNRGSAHLNTAHAAGAQQAAHDVGVDMHGLTSAIADIGVDRMGQSTVRPPMAHTLSTDRFTTSGSLVNPKVA